MRRFRAFLVLVALVFGLATLVAGTRVLAGSDPGYVVFEPLLVAFELGGKFRRRKYGE